MEIKYGRKIFSNTFFFRNEIAIYLKRMIKGAKNPLLFIIDGDPESGKTRFAKDIITGQINLGIGRNKIEAISGDFFHYALTFYGRIMDEPVSLPFRLIKEQWNELDKISSATDRYRYFFLKNLKRLLENKLLLIFEGSASHKLYQDTKDALIKTGIPLTVVLLKSIWINRLSIKSIENINC